MTRMWLVEPAYLCRQHLLGEHKELHQLAGHIRAGNLASVRGHAEQGQIDTSLLQHRHTQLVPEMQVRGYNHDSPLASEDDLELGEIDIAANREELRERCADCAARMASFDGRRVRA